MRGFTLERTRFTSLHVGSVSIVHLVYIVIQKNHSKALYTQSYIRKYFVTYQCFVQTDMSFWEPDNAIFLNRVQEWINLKKDTFTFPCGQPIHIF